MNKLTFTPPADSVCNLKERKKINKRNGKVKT